MRFTLPESARRRQRAAAGTFVSVLLHGAAISAMLAATAMSAERAPRPAPVTELLVYVQPPAQRSVSRAPAQPAAPPVSAPPTAPPERFVTPDVTPVAAVNVPATLPDPSSALFAPTGAATPERMGAEAGTTTAGAAAPGAIAAWAAHEVEREVVALRGTTPRYPETLARAGVEGVVVARFVVDTIGRVERASVEITRTDHALFEQSVREALARMRFAPAEARGRKVRQLVEQPFAFALRSR